MSVVACRVNENGYTIAADSITVRGYTQDKGKQTAFSKLFRVNGLIVGGVGMAEELSLFQVYAATHQIAMPNESAVLEFFSEFAEWKKKKIDKAGLENSYFIGVENVIFYINGWHVTRVVTFEALGAGMDYALAALHLGHTSREAVQTAIELSVFCEGPIRELSKTFKT